MSRQQMRSGSVRRPSVSLRGEPKKVLLDTNVWSRIGDEGAGPSLSSCLSGSNLQLVLAPSMLIEAQQNPNSEARDRIVRAMAMARGLRLRTEADRQGDEVIGEVRRLHPEWLRQTPSVHTALKHRRFWTSTVWKESTRHPDAFQAHYMARSEPIVQHLSKTQDATKDDFRANVPMGVLTLLDSWTTLVAGSENPMPGWDGQRAEAWRIAVGTLMRHQLHVVYNLSEAGLAAPSTYADWIGSYVDLRAMYADPALVTRFFLQEVELIRMPRLWLATFAVPTSQLYFKIGHGNAQDQQHSAYLLDCDLFLTGDRRYWKCLEMVRSRAPFQMAETRLVSGDSTVPIVDRVQAALP